MTVVEYVQPFKPNYVETSLMVSLSNHRLHIGLA